MAAIGIPLHAFTGADAVSGFYGQGKARIYSKVKKKSDDARKFEDLKYHFMVFWQPF